MAVPGCSSQLAGWAVAEGISHRPSRYEDLSQPHGAAGDIPILVPCSIHAPGPCCLPSLGPAAANRYGYRSCQGKNNTSGGINKLFLCIRGGCV